MKKRILSLALALMMCLTLLPTAAFAADGDFTIENGVLTKYNGSGGDVVIPSGVTSIGEGAFNHCRNLTSVTIPNGVTSIGDYAFYYCDTLTSVTIPDSVTSIGDGVFSYCESLTSLTIPDSVIRIGTAAFSGCAKLTSVTIPDSVTSIGDGVFSYCVKLTSVTISDSVTSIGDGMFSECDSLTSVIIPAGVTSIGDSVFSYCDSLTSVTIPDSVTSIGNYAFTNCVSLTSVTIPSSVTSIGYGAFASCESLTSVTIPAGVTAIEHNTFDFCLKLTSVTIPASVTSIGYAAFLDCASLTNATILNGNAEIDTMVFYQHDFDVWEYTEEFMNIPGLTVTAPAGGKVEQYCKDNGIAFRALNGEPKPLAYASTQNVLVDGKPVEFQCYALKDANGYDTNYIKVRDLAYVLNGTAAQFNVGWDGSVNLEKGKAYASNGSEMKTPFSGNRAYQASAAQTKVDGAVVKLESIVLNDDNGGGYTYYKLRDLGAALGFTVDWSAEKGVYIETK